MRARRPDFMTCTCPPASRIQRDTYHLILDAETSHSEDTAVSEKHECLLREYGCDWHVL
jgi:hypothetical protein